MELPAKQMEKGEGNWERGTAPVAVDVHLEREPRGLLKAK